MILSNSLLSNTWKAFEIIYISHFRTHQQTQTNKQTFQFLNSVHTSITKYIHITTTSLYFRHILFMIRKVQPIVVKRPDGKITRNKEIRKNVIFYKELYFSNEEFEKWRNK